MSLPSQTTGQTVPISNTSPPPPQLRLATPRDARRIAELGADAFRSIPIIKILYPKSQTDFPAYLVERTEVMKRAMVVPRQRFLVAVEPLTGEIMGYGLWARYGDTRRIEEEFGVGLPDLERVLMKAQDWVNDWVWGWSKEAKEKKERSARYKKIQAWMEGFWRELGMGERWYLESVVVAPEFRRRGVGAALVEWGVKRARKEGVVAALEATEMGRPVYERQGFVKVGEDVNVVEGVELFMMMVCEPAKFELH